MIFQYESYILLIEKAMNIYPKLRLSAISIIIALVTACMCAYAGNKPAGFERYNVILERRPFGEISPSDVSVTPIEESFAKHLEMRDIIDYGYEIRVGFLDKKSKENIYLGIGENIDGIELVSVDYENEEATLRKDHETSVLALKKNKKTAGKAMPKISADRSTQTAVARRRRPFFTSLKKRKITPITTDGSAMPFRGKTIEEFLKEHPEVAGQYPSPIHPSGQILQAGKRGETIERFLHENAGTGQQFSPIQPPDPSVITDGKGETIERFLREHSGQLRDIQPSVPISFPAMEQPIENSE